MVSGFHFSMGPGIDLSGGMDMGYRIEYCEGSVIWKEDRFRWGRALMLGGVCFLVFCAMAMYFWPEGGAILQSWLFPGDMIQTRNALRHMASGLEAGQPLMDTVYAFCREILNGAVNPG